MSEVSHGSSLREHLLLFSRFLRSPRTVGAVSASSQVLARRLVDDLHFKSPLRIVELGPGTGALTGTIVERLGKDDRFLALDIDPTFVAQVRQRWPAVECLCASAEQVDVLARERGMEAVDHIISGLPFTSLPVEVSDRIVQSVAKSLRPGGTFTTFQYIWAYSMEPARKFRQKMTDAVGAGPRRLFVLRNLPPAWILTWQKPEASGVAVGVPAATPAEPAAAPPPAAASGA
ncbi:MAG: methyltransferase domain-containing protein [Vicinamibacterales bacterium]